MALRTNEMRLFRILRCREIQKNICKFREIPHKNIFKIREKIAKNICKFRESIV